MDSSVFADVAAVIGEHDARRLCDALGGTLLYVPAMVGANHPICAAIGAASAKKLCDHFKGETLQLPKSYLRRTRVLQLYERGGMTLAQIALATDYSERHVMHILAESRSDDGQLELFA